MTLSINLASLEAADHSSDYPLKAMPWNNRARLRAGGAAQRQLSILY